MDIKFERRHVAAPDIHDISGDFWMLDECNESLTIIQFDDCEEGKVFFIPHAVLAKTIQQEFEYFAVAWDQEQECYVFIEQACTYLLCDGGYYAEEAFTEHFSPRMMKHLEQDFDGYAAETSIAGHLFYVQTEEK